MTETGYRVYDLHASGITLHLKWRSDGHDPDLSGLSFVPGPRRT